jgi:hypothetical protein
MRTGGDHEQQAGGDEQEVGPAVGEQVQVMTAADRAVRDPQREAVTAEDEGEHPVEDPREADYGDWTCGQRDALAWG